MKRRKFLKYVGYTGSGILVSSSFPDCTGNLDTGGHHSEYSADIIIVGGGLGGCAAALAACSQDFRVILTEPTTWIGGQVSQQGVPPDEHQWIESFGRSKSYARFRNLIRRYYRNHYSLSHTARQSEYFNPGNGMVSRLCHEPGVARTVLEYMMVPELQNGRLKLLYNTKPVDAMVSHDEVRTIQCENTQTGERIVLNGLMYIDASEEGDLLPLTGTEYVLGAESVKDTGESHAPDKADPGNIQALTWCFAMDHVDGEDHIIKKPEMYDFWSEHVPSLSPPWSGKLLSLSYSNPRTLEPRALSFVPPTKGTPAPPTEALNLWLYRRIIDKNNFKEGTFGRDITLVNWPQNDFMLGNITDVTDEARNQNMYKAKQLSLSLLYWLQTQAPRPDGGEGWKGLRLRKDVFGTADGLAHYPYIRESRRIRAEFTVREQDLSLEEREKLHGDQQSPVLATPFHDSIGIGYYHLDLHPSTGGNNYIDMPSVPFQIPLGAMIPVRLENLIPGCKNIGTTHISNGCYRLHPVEWSIGEAAGHLCAYALRKKVQPRAVRNTPELLEDFQSLLIRNGIELTWARLI